MLSVCLLVSSLCPCVHYSSTMPRGGSRNFLEGGGGAKIFPETEDLLHGTRPTNRGWGGQTYLYVEYLNGVGGLSAAPALNPP